MKHTVKIDATRSLVIEPARAAVVVTLTTFGVVALQQLLRPDQAAVLSQALEIAAGQAEQSGKAAA